MKRVNLILISEPAEPVAFAPGSAVTFDDNSLDPADISDETFNQLKALELELELNPALADLPELKPLIEINKGIDRAFGKKDVASPAPAADTTKTDTTKTDTTTKVEPTGLEGLPFFGGAFPVNTDAFKDVTVEKLPDIAKSMGIDTSNKDYLGLFLQKLSGNQEAATKVTEYETQLKSIQDDIAALPKEIQLAMKAIADGKDWRTVIGGATALDFTKEFTELSKSAKIQIHNHFFPDDKIANDADVTDKQISKSLSLAESKFNVEKQSFENQKVAAETKKANSNKEWNNSVSASMNELKTKYPNFKPTDLAKIQQIIEKDGIASLFVDKQGKMTTEGAKRVAFALYGDKILETAVAVAQNKGKSAGKAEVLQNNNSRGANNGGGNQQLTDAEQSLLKMATEAQNAAFGTQNPY